MRSRREEYTKRFEELTKQEIKNYNDSLLATHVAMEEFRRQLKGCVDLYAQQVAQLSSQIKTIEAENRDLKDAVTTLSRKVESQRDDFNQFKREKIERSREAQKFIDCNQHEWSRQRDKIEELADNNNANTFMMQHRVAELSQEVKHCYSQSKADNEKLKEEILALPSEAEKVKEHLLGKISIAAVDNAGLTKELEVFKKQMLIQGKMNEYFHTQLDRLKKRLQK